MTNAEGAGTPGEGTGRGGSRVWVWVRRLLRGGLGLIAVLVLAYVLITLVMNQLRASSATREATEGYRAADRVQAEFAATEQKVAEAVGAAPEHRGRAYACEIDTVEGGWMIMSYVNRCEWLMVDYVPVDDLAGTVASLGYGDSDPQECSALSIPALEDRAWVRVTTRPADRSAGGDDLWCQDGTAEETFLSAAWLDNDPRIVVTSPIDPAVLDDGRDWVVVLDHVQLSRTELGCGLSIFPFCEQPIREPRLPRP